MDKLAFTVSVITRELRHYVRCHTIVVLTSQYSLKNVLENLDVSERVAYIPIKLSKFDIHFKPRLVIKSQAMANFIIVGVEREQSIQVVIM